MGSFELVDFLQMAGLGHRSVVIQAEHPTLGSGCIEIVKGEVWNASVATFQGEAAIAFLVDESAKIVAIEPLVFLPETRQVNRSMACLLLDLATDRDEAARGCETPLADDSQHDVPEQCRAACGQALQGFPEESGIAVVDLVEEVCLATAYPQRSEWSGFSAEVALTAITLLGSLKGCKLDFGRASANNATDSVPTEQLYFATAACQYFVVRLPERPSVAIVLAAPKTMPAGHGWVCLNLSLSMMVQAVEGLPHAAQRGGARRGQVHRLVAAC